MTNFQAPIFNKFLNLNFSIIKTFIENWNLGIENLIFLKKNLRYKFFLIITFSYCQITTSSAQTNVYKNDVNTPKPMLYAFTHATIYIDYKTKIEDATLLINEGKIISAGKNIDIPKDATVVDLYGKYIYP